VETDTPQRPPWRTVGAVLALAAMNLLAGWFAATHPGEFTAKMFDTLSYTFLGFAALLTMKAVGEIAAGGSGFKGIVRTLMTSAKPGEEVK
jgi:hypothetical protein